MTFSVASWNLRRRRQPIEEMLTYSSWKRPAVRTRGQISGGGQYGARLRGRCANTSRAVKTQAKYMASLYRLTTWSLYAQYKNCSGSSQIISNPIGTPLPKPLHGQRRSHGAGVHTAMKENKNDDKRRADVRVWKYCWVYFFSKPWPSYIGLNISRLKLFRQDIKLTGVGEASSSNEGCRCKWAASAREAQADLSRVVVSLLQGFHPRENGCILVF